MEKYKFSAGIYSILKYADGLSKKGHVVNIIPPIGSKKPKWIDCSANFMLNAKERLLGHSVNSTVKNIVNWLDKKLYRKKNVFTQRAIRMDYMRYAIPDADITIATLWDTAEIVYRFGKGEKAYLIQHFEPVFFETESYEKKLCEWSYQLPLNKIVISTWIEQKVETYCKNHKITDKVYKCVHAVDLDIFKKIPVEDYRENPKHLKIISYGGRNVKWKGFEEMAQAIAMVREKLPDYNIEWLVYGDAMLPPNNPIAEYTQLGFLQPRKLALAYNKCDIMLSASWYEGFSVFALEAMACGLAVITTRYGTEDYAIHGFNAEIVEERNPYSIANGIIKLVTDKEYRKKLSHNGHATAQRFNWSFSINNMEQILFEILEVEQSSKDAKNKV
ncbi:MAG: glycosyltransferase family 4 protein [Nitrospirota bacterium]